MIRAIRSMAVAMKVARQVAEGLLSFVADGMDGLRKPDAPADSCISSASTRATCRA